MNLQDVKSTDDITIKIRDFVKWAFYDSIDNQPISVVYKSYLIYCNLFGIDNRLDNKELQDGICKCYNVIKWNGKYVYKK